VSNLGDSRAVVGLFSRSSRADHEGSQLITIPMSKDHTAADEDERSRVEREHPNDPTCVVKMSDDDDDWRVKQIAAFTRSIGDCQMKDKAASTLYNTYTRRKVMPRPGVRAKGESQKTKPYIINAPEFCQHDDMEDGFLIVACDGVWDEMTSEEAVRIVAQLIVDNLDDDSVDIAEIFVEEVLKKVVERCRASYEEEHLLTLAQLKARPCGKKDFAHRSCLHDDITVCILRFTSADEGEERATAMKVAVESAASTTAEQLTRMARDIFEKIDIDGSGSITGDELALLAGRLGKPLTGDNLVAVMSELDVDQSGDVDFEEFKAWWPKYCQRQTSRKHRTMFDGIVGDIIDEVAHAQRDASRTLFDEQIIEVIKFMDGKLSSELQADFNALDVDGNGELNLDEVRVLVQNVFGRDVEGRVVSACFDQMDTDKSAAVDFDEFCSFFGVSLGRA
jgi:Ca2+-binding EF-hand superfamily protein/serine/threonine protein phosphatase PrpC